jgi:CelD/BcsL family acetyltransferase involved in cellulose biosynthesis
MLQLWGNRHLARECPSENRHNNRSRNSRIRKFGEVSYAQANIDREESKKLNKVFEKNVLIDRNEEIDESNSAMTNLKRQTPRH